MLFHLPFIARLTWYFKAPGKNKLTVRQVCQWENLFNLAHRNLSSPRVDTQRQAHVSARAAHLLEVFREASVINSRVFCQHQCLCLRYTRINTPYLLACFARVQR